MWTSAFSICSIAVLSGIVKPTKSRNCTVFPQNIPHALPAGCAMMVPEENTHENKENLYGTIRDPDP